jgi:hypothetical protein
MRSILTSKLALGLALVGLGLLENSSALAGEPIVAIPVTGGQFTVDMKIQDNIVQNYGYKNNQIPTLLSPVGTISLTSATTPHIVSLDKNQTMGNYAMLEPSKDISVSVLTTLTGRAGLNDGRNAQFENAPANFRGLATASSPISTANLFYLTKDSIHYSPIMPAAGPLPEYQGSIDIKIQSGHIMVPNSAFSTAQTTTTRFDVNSGTIYRTDRYATSQQLGTKLISYPDIYGTMRQFNISRYGMLVFPGEIFSSDPSQVTATSRVSVLSPMGTTSLSLTNLAVLNSINPLPGADGSMRDLNSSKTVSAVANGTVMLANGRVVNVVDRLMTFDLGTIENPPLSEDGSLSGMFAEKRPMEINLKQGSVYIDTPAPLPVISSNPSEPKELTEVPPIAIPNLSEFGISSETRITTEPVAQTQLESPNLQPSSMTMNGAILSSPLSSSRIFPEVGISR